MRKTCNHVSLVHLAEFRIHGKNLQLQQMCMHECQPILNAGLQLLLRKGKGFAEINDGIDGCCYDKF